MTIIPDGFTESNQLGAHRVTCPHGSADVFRYGCFSVPEPLSESVRQSHIDGIVELCRAGRCPAQKAARGKP